MKLSINTNFWKQENYEKHNYILSKIMFFMLFILIGNVIISVFTNQILLAIINIPPLILTWLASSSYTQHIKEEEAKKCKTNKQNNHIQEKTKSQAQNEKTLAKEQQKET